MVCCGREINRKRYLYFVNNVHHDWNMRFPGGGEKFKIYSAVCEMPVVVLEATVAQLGQDADKI